MLAKMRVKSTHSLLTGMQAQSATVEISMETWRRISKLELELQYDPDKPLLTIHPTRFLSHHRDTDTSIFTADLFTIPRKWNQPRCPSAS